MLYKRVLVAAVGIPILLPMLIYAGHLVNFIFFLIVALIALGEFFHMAFQDDLAARRMGMISGGLLFAVWGLGIIYEAPPLLFHLAFVTAFIAVFFFFLFCPGDIKTVGTRVALGVLGLVYVNGLLIYFVALHNLEKGWRYVIMLFAIIWLNDTGAYFAGRLLGRHKFYEKVSPKKTWEGSFGGVFLGLLGAFLFDALLSLDWPALHLVVLSIALGYLGQLGDLCESLLKRSFEVKDSGRIIPGHGGILDRADALLMAAPFLYYYIRLVLDYFAL